ncbi:MAG: helix-hairpin-helix domain-containing protein [Nitrospiraceae bacterium]|nr:MAG: helix-hairpin-helix domain-containing protein [Nitrospiraceae bacterium]
MKRKVPGNILRVILIALAISIMVNSISFAADISPVHINQATAKELTALPGIGKKKAEAIVAYREKNGKYRSIEDIEKVEGIGKDTLDKIKSYIVLE